MTDKTCHAIEPAAAPGAVVRGASKTEATSGSSPRTPQRKDKETRRGDTVSNAAGRPAVPGTDSVKTRELAERCARYRLESEIQDALARAGGPARTVREHKEKKKRAEARILAECG